MKVLNYVIEPFHAYQTEMLARSAAWDVSGGLWMLVHRGGVPSTRSPISVEVHSQRVRPGKTAPGIWRR